MYTDKFEKWNKNIVDCITCADGGIKYISYLSTMRNIAKDADAGDQAAIHIIKIIEKFNVIIETM